MPGSRIKSSRTRLVLPPPEGAARTNKQPDAGGGLVVMAVMAFSLCCSAALGLLVPFFVACQRFRVGPRRLAIARIAALRGPLLAARFAIRYSEPARASARSAP